MNLEKHNQHWQENFFYQFDIARTLFSKLAKNIDNKQIITVSGLRRTGKTVLMKQLINLLIKEKNIERTSILYYSFDEEQPRIEELMSEFEKQTNKDKSKIKLYIFLDELQKLEDWQNQLKYYYDNFDMKFIISGSSSLFIRRKAKESLAGRSFDFYLPPLNFNEFLLFRKKQELIKTDALFQDELKKQFSSYVKRQFIDTIDQDEEFISDYVKSILEKIVYIDIPKVFPIDHQDLLMRLLKIIASNPGMIIEYENLARELGINRVTLSNYLFYLEEAFLVRKLYNFSTNRLTSEKKSKRFYLSSTSFFSYLAPQIDESKIIENLAAIETAAKFFWRTPSKDEIDFILDSDKLIPVEVKWSKTLSKEDLSSIKKFCRKMNLCEGMVITKDLEEEKTIIPDDKKITLKLVPAWKFSLHESY